MAQKPYKVIKEKIFFFTRYYIKHIKLNKPVGYLDYYPSHQFHTIYYYSKERADAECNYLNENFHNN